MEKTRPKWLAALISGIMILLGVFLLANPAFALIQIVTVVSILVMAAGVGLIIYYLVRRSKGDAEWGYLASGILGALLGLVIFIFRQAIGITVLPTILGVGMLLAGGLRLFFALRMYSDVSRAAFWVTMASGLLSVVLGIIILTHTLATTALISILTGVFLVVFGVLWLVEMILKKVG